MVAAANIPDELKEALKSLPNNPGVYRMLNQDNVVIYVGKAVNLKKRVSSYFQKNHPDKKTAALVSHIKRIETTVTHTENEALILENNLIKSLRPRYNILFRDDKSYPYIHVSTNQRFPKLAFHRGSKKDKGRYFGPFPSAGSVRETLALMHKLFPVRQCKDTFFKNRSRPCLQYQIKRCTAPCVGLVEQEQYESDVRHAVMFLEGRSNDVIDELVQQMERASNDLEYEKAAEMRDQISSLRRIQEKQYISKEGGDYDVVATAIESGIGCIQVFTIRNGQNLGNRSYFPKHSDNQSTASLLEAFIPQHYFVRNNKTIKNIPANIILSEKIDNISAIKDVIKEQARHAVKIMTNVRGDHKRWIEMAIKNAQIAVKARIATHATLTRRFENLQEVLDLDEMPSRLECFDVSHSSGEKTVAACVVFGHEGAIKADYRRFNIKGITPGDDYAAMEQAILRRYQKIQQGEGVLPDILFVDGGKGQVNKATAVFDELQIANVMIIGVAKGPTRKAGMETLILAGSLSESDHEFILPADSPALHLIQQVRDEAHRFAITGHRQQRGKARTRSALEDIEGLGPKRRQKLLKQFGGIQEVARAGIDDLTKIPGISKQLAQKVYNAFHAET